LARTEGVFKTNWLTLHTHPNSYLYFIMWCQLGCSWTQHNTMQLDYWHTSYTICLAKQSKQNTGPDFTNKLKSMLSIESTIMIKSW